MLLNDFKNACVRAGEESDDAETDDSQVLPEYPVAASKSLVRAPVHNDLDNGREHES